VADARAAAASEAVRGRCDEPRGVRPLDTIEARARGRRQHAGADWRQQGTVTLLVPPSQRPTFVSADLRGLLEASFLSSVGQPRHDPVRSGSSRVWYWIARRDTPDASSNSPVTASRSTASVSLCALACRARKSTVDLLIPLSSAHRSSLRPQSPTAPRVFQVVVPLGQPAVVRGSSPGSTRGFEGVRPPGAHAGVFRGSSPWAARGVLRGPAPWAHSGVRGGRPPEQQLQYQTQFVARPALWADAVRPFCRHTDLLIRGIMPPRKEIGK